VRRRIGEGPGFGAALAQTLASGSTAGGPEAVDIVVGIPPVCPPVPAFGVTKVPSGFVALGGVPPGLCPLVDATEPSQPVAHRSNAPKASGRQDNAGCRLRNGIFLFLCALWVQVRAPVARCLTL